MYWEFAGLPGAGKTTLSLALKKHLFKLPQNILSRDEAIIKCIKRRDDGIIKNILKYLPPRIWSTLMGSQFTLSEFVMLSAHHLEFVAFVSETLSKSNLPAGRIESIWNSIVRSFFEIELISQHICDSELVIMDEAFFQRCLTLFRYMESTASDELISRYMKLAPGLENLIWIVVSPQNCVERVIQRYKIQSTPIIFQHKRENLLKNFEFGNTVMELFVQLLERQGKCVHRINGNNTVNEAISEICNTATKILKSYE